MAEKVWKVEVRDSETDEVVKTVETTSQARAEKVCDEIAINLVHEEYYTLIVEPK